MPEGRITQRCSQDRLSALPLELILEIASYLPIAAIISAKLVNRTLYNAMPTPTKQELFGLQPCARRAVRRAVCERKELESGFKQCVACDTLQSIRHFWNASLPVCSFHEKRFLRLEAPDSMNYDTLARISAVSNMSHKPSWLQLSRTFCGHCQVIIGWEMEHCGCRCDCCPKVEVQVFLRVPAGKDRFKSAELAPIQENRAVVIEAHLVGK
ncbi:hypothetical protein EJ03DRAFT_135039 [Teratosphaeria nubilosa]|uniref:F-box domain-containing protein n=1 Tax=Teratosphaeria nubilosa TaxID=161662 RepID=A0A6G1L539_9PEZI|nr:hypothetical protein EJ03DRAFT_135039 [Teratosphaeria nubilosa]